MPNEYENGFVYGIANQDFYVYLDELGNIHEGLIDIDKRAKEEMEKAKEELRNKLMTESENYGLWFRKSSKIWWLLWRNSW